MHFALSRLGRAVALALMFLPCVMFTGCGGRSPNLEGAWLGQLEMQGVKLRLVFHLARNPQGGWSGTLDSPDQGSKDIPITVASVKDAKVVFHVPPIAGIFEGTLDPAQTRLTGQWKQGPASLPLTLEKTDPARLAQAVARAANPESIEANKETGGALVGDWEGVLHAGAELHLEFHITKTPEGGLLGTMDSLDQRALGIPVTKIYHEPDTIFLEVATIGGVFEAQLEKGELTGTWRQGGRSLPLTLTRKP